jgi:hypothetical protein
VNRNRDTNMKTSSKAVISAAFLAGMRSGSAQPHITLPRFQRRRCAGWILPGLLLALTSAAKAQYIYTTNDDGRITITGYTGSGGALTIPDTIDGRAVNSIGDNAFAGAGLTSLTIPNSVSSIGDGAFADCTSLTSVTIPDTVTELGRQAFEFCSGMTNVTIGNRVTNIGGYAFVHCVALTSVSLPDSVSRIGVGAFTGCGLTSMTIGSGLTEIGSGNNYFTGAGTFSDCTSLTNFTVDPLNTAYSSPDGILFDNTQHTLIAYPGGRARAYVVPDSVTAIAPAAFSVGRLTTVTIGKSVINIGDYAFYRCDGLTSLTIPNTATSIGDHAFSGCAGLTSLTLPNGVTNIGVYAFEMCSGLTNVTIPNSVTTLGLGTFFGCTGLTGATIPNSVTGIMNQVFAGCSGLRNIFFAGNAPLLLDGPPGIITDTIYTNAIVYFLPGTKGWGESFGGCPAVLWNPKMKIDNEGAALHTNGFSFTIVGTRNIPFVLETTTNLANGPWTSRQTETLFDGLISFSDPEPLDVAPD